MCKVWRRDCDWSEERGGGGTVRRLKVNLFVESQRWRRGGGDENVELSERVVVTHGVGRVQ